MSSPTLLRDVFRAKGLPPFHSLLNLWAIEEDTLVGVDLQFTRMFRLTCPDTLFYGEGDTTQHAVALGRLVDSMPPNCTAQMIVRVRWDGGRQLDAYQAAARPAGDMISFAIGERVDFLKRIPFRRVEHYLAITTHPTAPDLSALRIRPLTFEVPKPTPILEAQHKRRMEQLNAVCGNALAALRDARVSASALSGKELCSFIYEHLNPATAAHTEPPAFRPSKTLRSQLALNACDVGFDTVTVDGHYHRAVNLQMRPTMLDGRAMHVLLNQLPGDFDLVVAVHSLAQEKAEKTLQSTAAAAHTLSTVHVTRYHEAELLTQDADQLAAFTKGAFQNLFQASVHVVLRDVERTRLTRNTDQAIQAFRRLDDAVGIVDDMNHLTLYLAALPGHAHLNPRTHLVPTEVAARFLTASASWDGSPAPQVLLPGDDGKLVGIDLFSSDELTAKHSLILGVSGEGKSVLTNTLLTSFYCADADNHVIVIDDGGSYRRLCELLEGQYLEPTLDGTHSFNPFLAREYAFDEQGQLDADFVSFITLMVQLMVRRSDFSNNEKSLIQHSVLAAYKLAGAETPLLSDLREAFRQLEGDEEDTKIAQAFFKDLALWTEGTYGRLLNQKSTFDASSRFLVFDLNKMTQEDLKPVLLLIIKSVIHPKLANKRLRKIIALDEVWKFLKEKAGADLVTEWYKTGRRFNTAVSVITQSPEDLLKSAAASAIADNSTVKWVLNLGGGYDQLHQLKLSPEEVEAIRALGKNPDRSKYRKVFLRFGNRKTIIRNVLSPRAYWLYTTDPQDLRCEQDLRVKEPKWTPIQVIESLAQMKEGHPEWRADDFIKEIATGRYPYAR
jgi:hypothetical protein